MMDRRSQAMGDPIVAISPTMTIKTPIAGPMAEINPTRNAVLVISGSICASRAVRLASRVNSSDWTSDTTTVTAQSAQTIGWLPILITSCKDSMSNRTPSKMISIK